MADQETATSTAEAVETRENAETTRLPLFYGAPEVLDATRHEGLGLDESISYGFTDKSNAIPVNAAEFGLIARDYPIVFIGEQQLNAVAIVGLQNGQNLMVDEAGAWSSDSYIPAYVRRYPFIFVRGDGGSQYALCVDRKSERVKTGLETKFFDGAELTQLGKNAMEFCTAFQREYMATENILKQLQELKLFIPHQNQYELANGEKLTLRDFKIIDEKRFNELPDADFLALKKSGALAVVYCHLVSLNSWQNLLRRLSVA